VAATTMFYPAESVLEDQQQQQQQACEAGGAENNRKGEGRREKGEGTDPRANETP